MYTYIHSHTQRGTLELLRHGDVRLIVTRVDTHCVGIRTAVILKIATTLLSEADHDAKLAQPTPHDQRSKNESVVAR